MITLVTRGDDGPDQEALLARGVLWKVPMYSCLAGFVEPGESLEQCVAREVAEEVGVTLASCRYFASQSWPFPHSLMIAFICEWQSGEIRPQAGEIEEETSEQNLDRSEIDRRGLSRDQRAKLIH
jgi:NAD+ diphosphatase